jgi:general secretion pathway protein H
VRGFTLIELIIVLVILSIASTLAGILITRGPGELELRSLAKHMATTLNYARNQAISEKKVYSFVILAEEKAYGLYANFDQDTDSEKPLPVVYESIPEKLTVVFENREEFKRIDFTPRGISSGGIIEIRDQKGRKFILNVNRITGRTEVNREDGSS